MASAHAGPAALVADAAAAAAAASGLLSLNGVSCCLAEAWPLLRAGGGMAGSGALHSGCRLAGAGRSAVLLPHVALFALCAVESVVRPGGGCGPSSALQMSAQMRKSSHYEHLLEQIVLVAILSNSSNSRCSQNTRCRQMRLSETQSLLVGASRSPVLTAAPLLVLLMRHGELLPPGACALPPAAPLVLP